MGHRDDRLMREQRKKKKEKWEESLGLLCKHRRPGHALGKDFSLLEASGS